MRRQAQTAGTEASTRVRFDGYWPVSYSAKSWTRPRASPAKAAMKLSECVPHWKVREDFLRGGGRRARVTRMHRMYRLRRSWVTQ